MNIFNTIQNSVYNPEFYANLKNKTTKSSVKYFILFSIILSVVSTIFQSYTVASISHQVFDPRSIDALVLMYPEDLTITIKNGLVSTNVKEPYDIFGPVSQDVFGGVGLESNKGVVTNVYVGKPAEQAGIQKGDVILSIDGEKIDTLSHYAEKIRGAVGTSVTLVVSRAGTSEPLSFTIVRASIQTEAKKFTVIDTSLSAQNVSLNDFQKYNVQMLVTKDAIAIMKDGLKVYSLAEFFQTDTIINRETIRSTIDKYQPAAEKLVWFAPIILFAKTFLTTILYLVEFFFIALLVWILLRIMGKNHGYVHAYRTTLHAATLALMIGVFFGYHWYVNIIIIALVVLVNMAEKKD